MAVTGFSELTFGTRDAAALERFYGNVFGLLRIASEPERIWLAVGNRRGSVDRKQASISASWR